MAFKIRCEYFILSSDGVGTVILDDAHADATEHTATASATSLPATNGSYAMCVTSLTGAATVEVATTPTGDADRGKLVTEGNHQWFVIKKDDKMTVLEYAMP
jgi:hypothetical protein